MFIRQLHATSCFSLINKCPNHLHTVLNFINFELNIFGPLPVISGGSAPGPCICLLLLFLLNIIPNFVSHLFLPNNFLLSQNFFFIFGHTLLTI